MTAITVVLINLGGYSFTTLSRSISRCGFAPHIALNDCPWLRASVQYPALRLPIPPLDIKARQMQHTANISDISHLASNVFNCKNGCLSALASLLWFDYAADRVRTGIFRLTILNDSSTSKEYVCNFFGVIISNENMSMDNT